MKRQIFTALSLTLLISSPLTLDAGKPGRKKKKVGGSSNALNTLGTAENIEGGHPSDDDNDGLNAASPNTPAPITSSYASDLTTLALSLAPSAASSSSSSSSSCTDEFDPKDTQAQRAALLAAIVALEHKKSKVLKPVHCYHALERQRVLVDLYTYEEPHTIISASTKTVATSPAPAVHHDILDLFPTSPTQPSQGEDIAVLFQGTETTHEFLDIDHALNANVRPMITELQHQLQLQQQQQQQQVQQTKSGNDDDFERLSQTSSDGNKNSNNDVVNNNNNNNNAAPTTTTTTTSTTTPTITPTPAPAAPAQLNIVWRILGYK